LPSARYFGYTLLIHTYPGIVCELDSTGKMRWQIAGLSEPQDACVVPGDRVLIAETGARRVTERSFKGDILWQKDPGAPPIGVQRLPNGRTLIVMRNRIVEVDRSGREVYALDRPGNDILTARRLRDGRMMMVSLRSSLSQLDQTGREVKPARLLAVSNLANDLLPSGGVLVPLLWQNKVLEYDADGKTVWDASVLRPVSAFRLPNGHTLVSTQESPAKLIEFDREGKQVAETAASNPVVRATRR
jgi:hypothetical protein